MDLVENDRTFMDLVENGWKIMDLLKKNIEGPGLKWKDLCMNLVSNKKNNQGPGIKWV